MQYDDRTIVGLLEPVIVKGRSSKEKAIIARIDTGATKSSIDEQLVKELELGPILTTRMTKQAAGSTMRPVIKVKIELAKRRFNFQFTVADRSKMRYKVLIGQNILKRNFLIDPLKKVTK